MPQWRKLHTKVTESLDFNDIPDYFSRCLWLMLPLKLCREGRGLDSPAWVRSQYFPLDENVTLEQCGQALDCLAELGMIVRYSVNGRRYFHIPEESWNYHQGNTEKEAASIYPSPCTTPEQRETSANPTPDLLQTNSGLTPDLLQTNSSTDADADADAEEIPESAGADPPNDSAGFTTFQEWQTYIKAESNRPAALLVMFKHLYPGHDPPSYGYVGKTAREVGGAGRLADLLWQHSTRPPTGDPLAYIQGIAKRSKQDGTRKTDHRTDRARPVNPEVLARQRAALRARAPADQQPPPG